MKVNLLTWGSFTLPHGSVAMAHCATIALALVAVVFTPAASGLGADAPTDSWSKDDKVAKAIHHQNETAEVDEFVQREMQVQHIPGVSLAVVKAGQIVLARGYGLANVEHQMPVKPETVFQSGSMGKQFTATAIMMHVAAGKIGLDDPVRKYLTNAPSSWEKIRVRHLLTHTAGLGDYPPDFDFRRDYTEDELLARLGVIPLKFQPGEQWRYSNVGYVTLGILLSKVSGRFYGDFLGERIFKPLEMKTARIISEADIVTNRAAGYRFVKGELKNQEWVSPTMNTTADGSLYLSVYDMAKWDAALYTERLLKRSSLDQMWMPVKLNNGQTRPYGFGWALGEVRGHRLIHHGGAWQGFQSGILRCVEDQLTVIAFDNLAGANLDKIIRGVAAIYNSELAPERPRVNKNVPTSAFDAVLGRYDYGGPILTVTREGDRLFAQLTGQPKCEIFPQSETNFFWEVVDAQVTFVKDPAGKVTKAIHQQGGVTLEAPKLQ